MASTAQVRTLEPVLRLDAIPPVATRWHRDTGDDLERDVGGVELANGVELDAVTALELHAEGAHGERGVVHHAVEPPHDIVVEQVELELSHQARVARAGRDRHRPPQR
ncbi:MAG: hypothetical protein IPN47_12845 [Gemmatimonadetes bacterium]|nr:hypothetical protein [Gemmatimonadota bacterium]